MKKLVLFVVMFSLAVPTSYGMKNISKKMPKYNLFKKDFSTKAWQWGKGWNYAKNYPKLRNSKLFNKAAILKDIKIENVSIINKDTDNSEIKKNIATRSDPKIMINLSDPKQSSKFIRKMISKWTDITEGSLREFYESIPWLRNRKKVIQKPSFAQAKIKNEEQAGGGYWKYFLGGAVAAYLAKLFSDTARQESLELKEIPFDYSLDGELARSMSAKTFVALLHKYGFTVIDAVEYQVKKKEEEIYKEIIRIADLTERDWRMLQNLLQLKEEFLQGHYDEDNVTFKGDFDSQTIAMVKSVLQKADIPFQLTVVTKDTTTFSLNSKADASVCARWDLPVNLELELEKAEFDTFGYINIELYLSDIILDGDELNKLAVLAHETTHLLNMDNLQQRFFKIFLEGEKKLDENKIKDCLFSLGKLQEYRADTSLLAVPKYAQAQKHSCSFANRWFYKDCRSDIYIPNKKLFTLASRAVELHEAEAKLLKINRIGDKK